LLKYPESFAQLKYFTYPMEGVLTKRNQVRLNKFLFALGIALFIVTAVLFWRTAFIKTPLAVGFTITGLVVEGMLILASFAFFLNSRKALEKIRPAASTTPAVQLVPLPYQQQSYSAARIGWHGRKNSPLILNPSTPTAVVSPLTPSSVVQSPVGASTSDLMAKNTASPTIKEDISAGSDSTKPVAHTLRPPLPLPPKVSMKHTPKMGAICPGSPLIRASPSPATIIPRLSEQTDLFLALELPEADPLPLILPFS
jgi:hypothetical protein